MYRVKFEQGYDLSKLVPPLSGLNGLVVATSCATNGATSSNFHTYETR
jgi:hypothetical protein